LAILCGQTDINN